MRNKFLYILLTIMISLLVNKSSLAEQLQIKSTEVNIQKKSRIKFSGDVEAKDKFNNTLKANEAIYSKSKDLLRSNGLAKLLHQKIIFLKVQILYLTTKTILLDQQIQQL